LVELTFSEFPGEEFAGERVKGLKGKNDYDDSRNESERKDATHDFEKFVAFHFRQGEFQTLEFFPRPKQTRDIFRR
jgi:hypothetical protein